MPGGTWVPGPRHAGTSPCPEFPGPDAYPGPFLLLLIYPSSTMVEIVFYPYLFLNSWEIFCNKKKITFTSKLYRLNFFLNFFWSFSFFTIHVAFLTLHFFLFSIFFYSYWISYCYFSFSYCFLWFVLYFIFSVIVIFCIFHFLCIFSLLSNWFACTFQ